MVNWVWVFWNWVIFIGRVGVKIVWSCWIVGLRVRDNLIVIWEGKRGRKKIGWRWIEVFLRIINIIVGDIVVSWRRKVMVLSGV